MAMLREIVIDARNPPALARFWAAVLDDYVVRPYDDAEIARLATIGLTPDTDTGVPLDGPGPTIYFQQVDGLPTARNRVHFDIACRSRADEVARLMQLGATVRDVHATHTVMLDPEGNNFCVVETACAVHG
jgi:hypothetical protein